MIRVELPESLRTLAKVSGEVTFEIGGNGDVSLRAVLDAVEARYPMLRGTIRDHDTQERRAFLRFFACGKDISLLSRGELEALFGAALPERIGPLVKSWVCVRAPSAAEPPTTTS